ncbi:MAG TPA: hypothetical protein VEM57_00285 [Candidatus Binatus sp.]|nr:hypothetical protein [Candidatus Binatus sp.]
MARSIAVRCPELPTNCRFSSPALVLTLLLLLAGSAHRHPSFALRFGATQATPVH